MSSITGNGVSRVPLKGAAYKVAYAKLAPGWDTRRRVSKFIIWALRFSIFGFFAMIIAIGLHYFGYIATTDMLAVLGSGAVLAIASCMAVIAGYIEIWQQGIKGIFRSFWALIFAGLCLAPIAWVAFAAFYHPKISGVTTNLENPPIMLADFTAVRSLERVSQANLMTQVGQHPDLQTAVFKLDVPNLYRIAKSTANRQGWSVGTEYPPAGLANITEDTDTRSEVASIALPRPRPSSISQGDLPKGAIFTSGFGTGIFEAQSKTTVFNFTDDLVVRITDSDEGAIIDIRSASRLGSHDLGANFKRVDAYLIELDLSVKAWLAGQDQSENTENEELG